VPSKMYDLRLFPAKLIPCELISINKKILINTWGFFLDLSASIIFSLFIFYGFFAYSGAALLYFHFKNERLPYVASWAIATILVGTATFLIVLRDVLPLGHAHRLGNAFNMAAYVYFYYSYRSLLGKKICFKRVACKAIISSIALVGILTFVSDHYDPLYQTSVVAFFGMVINFFTGLLAFRYRQNNKIYLASLLGYIFLIGAFFWGLRFIATLFYGLGFAYEGGMGNVLTFTPLFVLGIVQYISFLTLVSSIEWQKKEHLIHEINLMKVDSATRKVKQSEMQYLATLNALAKARDNETGNHVLRTQEFVRLLALRLRVQGRYIEQLSDESIDLMVKAAPLHDIGKIGIPDSILLKCDGSLTDEEWVVMKTHTLIGESVLGALDVERDLESDMVAKAIRIAGGHHEKWNGSGYPRGLKGEAIPLEARIMALADMYDALVSERIYKKSWTHEEAVQEILSKQGCQFDPAIVDAFMAELDAFKAISAQYQDS
jgi:HD domain